MSEQPKCQLCGEPMPEGEEMFYFHGYSGPCPKPLIPVPKPTSKECVKLCIDAVKAAKLARDYEDSEGLKSFATTECLKVEAYEAMTEAIAAMPEET